MEPSKGRVYEMKMKHLFKFKYLKIFWLIISIIIAYIIFSNSSVNSFVNNLGNLSYLGIFIAGMLFSFGFTSPFAAGFFIILKPSSIWIASLIGGFGALICDLIIFKIIRFSFMDEFLRLEKTYLFKRINRNFEIKFGHKIKIYLMYAFAGIFIASPLPDEIGVIMLAGLSKIKAINLSIISIILNTLGIFVLLNI